MIRKILAAFHCICIIALLLECTRPKKKRDSLGQFMGDRTASDSGFIDMLTFKLDESDFPLVERAHTENSNSSWKGHSNRDRFQAPMSIGRRIGAKRLIVCQYQFDNTSNNTRPEKVPLSLESSSVTAILQLELLLRFLIFPML